MQEELPPEWSNCKRSSVGGAPNSCVELRTFAMGSNTDRRQHKRPCISRTSGISDLAEIAPTKSKPLRDEVLRCMIDSSVSYESEKLEVDSLICRLPYKQMLSSLNLSTSVEKCIPYVTRTYEESFMREPMYKEERQCAREKKCECMFIDPDHPFICVEFLLPGERPGTALYAHSIGGVGGA